MFEKYYNKYELLGSFGVFGKLELDVCKRE